MTLHDVIHELYRADQQVRGLEGRLTGAREQVRIQGTKLEQLRNQLADLGDQLRHAKAAEANLENDANSLEERIERLRDRMNNAQTSKEYSSLRIEVSTVKAEKEKLEEAALGRLAEVESLEARIESVRQKVAEQEKVKAVADQKLADRQAEVGEQIERVKRHREEAARAVPLTERAVFERLADSLEGEALAPVIRDDPKRMDFTCGGCYMSIPMEKVNQLMPQDKLVRCTSCQRILYLDEKVKETMGIRS